MKRITFMLPNVLRSSAVVSRLGMQRLIPVHNRHVEGIDSIHQQGLFLAERAPWSMIAENKPLPADLRSVFHDTA